MRAEVIGSVLELARSGGVISLESAARAAGMTKAGVMYHFPTKEELVTAVLEHLLDGYEQDLITFSQGRAPNELDATQRLDAYIDWAFETDFSNADLLMLVDPRLREHLAMLWKKRMSGWVNIPDITPAEFRTRLHCARLIADGVWFNIASDGLVLPQAERDKVREFAHALTKERT